MDVKFKEIAWNKYSRTIGLGLVAVTALAGLVEKKPYGKIVGNALYVGAFGIIIGSVINALKNPAAVTT